MDPVLKALFEQWGVESEAALMAKKSADEQCKDYFTQGPQRTKISAAECESLCRKYKVKYKPGYEDRVLEFTISTEKTDDGGDIMSMAGADMSRFEGNPIVHYNHKTMEPPVASCLKYWVTPDKTMKALALFADKEDDPTGRSDQIFRMADAGFIRGASIGFIPIKTVRPETADERANMKLGPYGLYFEKWKMTEWSVCNVPMNQEALSACMKALGAKEEKELFFISKGGEGSGNYGHEGRPGEIGGSGGGGGGGKGKWSGKFDGTMKNAIKLPHENGKLTVTEDSITSYDNETGATEEYPVQRYNYEYKTKEGINKNIGFEVIDRSEISKGYTIRTTTDEMYEENVKSIKKVPGACSVLLKDNTEKQLMKGSELPAVVVPQAWQPPPINITLTLNLSEIKNLIDKMENLSVQLKQLPLTLLKGGGEPRLEKSMYGMESKDLFPVPKF